ncbi:MAG TPA: hypothetical protein VMD49_10985 [Steroidobacteraceae bacterium]|nr:hypothetical protein [Steroidobacteraceae bacterium]HUN74701.1 hypothetical protein [Steroidobacteraceae bacterium]
MSIESHQRTETHSVLPHVAPGNARRGSSRMLEGYLGDIDYLVRERLWDEAAPLALALPHICVALARTDLASSREDYLAWCEEWVRPPEDEPSKSVPSPEQLYRMCEAHGVERELARVAGVPLNSLRQLRLRRLSRAAPPRRGVLPGELASARGEPEACAALLDAVHGWYGDWAAEDAIVQTNLARLAVLR